MPEANTLTHAETNAIREADNYTRCAGLPTYSELAASLRTVSLAAIAAGSVAGGACELVGFLSKD